MVGGYTPCMVTLSQCLHWTSFTWFYYPNSPLHTWWWSWKDKKEAFKNACRLHILFNRSIFMCVKWIVNQAIHSQDKATPIQKLSVSLKSGLCYHRKQIKMDSLFFFQTFQSNFWLPASLCLSCWQWPSSRRQGTEEHRVFPQFSAFLEFTTSNVSSPQVSLELSLLKQAHIDTGDLPPTFQVALKSLRRCTQNGNIYKTVKLKYATYAED